MVCATLREIVNDPDGFIFRKGWGSLDFGDGEQIAQLKRLWESLELEIGELTGDGGAGIA